MSQPLAADSQPPELGQIHTGGVRFWLSLPCGLWNSHLAISSSFSAGIFLHTTYYNRDILPGRFVWMLNRPNAYGAIPASQFQSSEARDDALGLISLL